MANPNPSKKAAAITQPLAGIVPGVWRKTAPPSAATSVLHDDVGSPQRPALAVAAQTTDVAPKTPVDPEGFYRIVVSKVAEAANQTFRPMHDYVVKGKVVTELGDAVKSYEASDLLH